MPRGLLASLGFRHVEDSLAGKADGSEVKAGGGDAAGEAPGGEPQKECDFDSFMLNNSAAKWSPLKKDIKWNYDHALHGQQIHVWWPGRASKGECNDLTDKSRGCWFRSRMLSDPSCLASNRCIHVAGHEGDPSHTFSCPTWMKDVDGSVCKLPMGWQACPSKFHMARVDTGIPQFLRAANMVQCDLTDGEKLYVGDWREPGNTIRYTVKQTAMAELQVTVEPNGQKHAPTVPGLPPLPAAPTESELLRRGQPRSEEVPGFGLATVKDSLEKRNLEGSPPKPEEDVKLRGTLLLEGEWMHAKLRDEYGAPTGAEVRMQIDEKGALLVSFKYGGADKEWSTPAVAIRDVKTEGGTADGASCMFPFTYKGMTYHDCTKADQGRPWCRTDELGNWGFCKGGVPHERPPLVGTHGGDFDGAGPKCMFPFTHNSTVYKTCKVIPDLAKDGLVCQTDAQGSWGYCNCKVDKAPGGEVRTHGGTAKGAKCKFPFTYEGRQYNTCQDLGDGAPACLTDDKGTWGYCNCRKPLHLLGPGGFDDEDKQGGEAAGAAAGHAKTPKGPKRPFNHCRGSTEGRAEINMIFDIRHNEWHRCTEKFRCEPFDIRAIRDAAAGECGAGHRCGKGEQCFEHRVSSKRSTFECVNTSRIYVLPQGDDAAKFASPWPLAALAPSLPPRQAQAARAARGCRGRRVGRFL